MKEEIEKMYIQALKEDLPSNVFADQVLRLLDVVGRNEQLCFCGQKLEIKVGDNRAWRECNNGHEQ